MATKPDRSTIERHIRDFLATAPDEISPWAHQTSLHLTEDEGVRLCLTDVAHADRQDDDGTTKSDDVATTPSIVTPSDKPERAHTESKTKMSPGAIAALITIAIIAIVFGVYLAGKPGDTDMADPPHGDMEAMNKMMNEAEAQMPASERAHRIAELNAILDKNPDDVQAHLEMGVLTFDQKDTESAQKHWEKVTELDPSVVAAWYNLGFLYQSLDPPQYDKAEEAWAKVVELAPNSDLARVVTMHSDALSHPENTTIDDKHTGSAPRIDGITNPTSAPSLKHEEESR